MKRLLALVVLLTLCWASAARADNYPVVSNIERKTSSGAVASLTTTAMTTTASGSTFVVVVSGEVAPPSSGSAVTDAKSNSYSLAVRATTGDSKVAIYYVANGTGGASHTFTYTPTSSDFITITALELTSVPTSSVLGSTNSGSNSGTTHASGNITSTNEELWVGACGTDHGSNGNPMPQTPTPWLTTTSIVAGGANEGINVAVYRAAPSTTAGFTCVQSATNSESAAIAAFKGSAGGGSATETAYTFVR